MQHQAQPSLAHVPQVARGGAPGADVSSDKIRRWAARDWVAWLQARSLRQYVAACVLVVAVAAIGTWLDAKIGYEAVALIYLLAVVLLALFLTWGPVLFGAALTAFAWGFMDAPPRYQFSISSPYDKMMLATYFVAAIIVGQLTSRLRLHREAELKAKLVAESERLSRTLLNSVSHELRTPIAAISGAASGLRASGELSANQQKLACEIESAAARLNRVVQSLLSAARLQAGQIRPKPDWCDVCDLVRVTLADVAPWTSGHQVKAQLAAGLPLVKFDFVLMQQALANLVMNAAMHTPPGTLIEVGARMEGEELLLEVVDDGPGLPAEELPRLFELFHRAPSARPGGAGLGLAIVKGFVEAQGGAVVAENRRGRGAIFRVTLPAHDAPDFSEEAA